MSNLKWLHIIVFATLLLTACAPRPDAVANQPQPEPSYMEKSLPDMSPTNSSLVNPPETSATPDPLQKKIINLAAADLASRLAVELNWIKIVSADSVTWPDSALGCPQPDQVYAQGKVPGFRIKLAVEGKEYIYHADRTGIVIPCAVGGSDNPDVVTTQFPPDDTLGDQIH